MAEGAKRRLIERKRRKFNSAKHSAAKKLGLTYMLSGIAPAEVLPAGVCAIKACLSFAGHFQNGACGAAGGGLRPKGGGGQHLAAWVGATILA